MVVLLLIVLTLVASHSMYLLSINKDITKRLNDSEFYNETLTKSLLKEIRRNN